MTRMTDKISVMIVEDSNYIGELISELVTGPRIEVCKVARDGREALRTLADASPDVILLDLELPNMDGLAFLEQLMSRHPLPVIIVSSFAERNTNTLFDCLECGAVDFVHIPVEGPLNLSRLKGALVNKIQIAARANPAALRSSIFGKMHVNQSRLAAPDGVAEKVAVIGSSTGGAQVVRYILSRLPADLPACMLVIQHMPPAFVTGFVRHLRTHSNMRILEAEDGSLLEKGTVFFAPGDLHMTVEPSRKIKLRAGPKRMGFRPSISVTMVSASEVYGPNAIGILLSGMGQDGVFGMKMIKKHGGRTIVQNESSSVVYGMGKIASNSQVVDRQVPAEEMPDEIVRAIGADR